jgi:hypothetical protein
MFFRAYQPPPRSPVIEHVNEPSSDALPPPPPPLPILEKVRTQSVNVKTIGSSLGNSSAFPPSPTEENEFGDIEKELENMKMGLEM